MNLDHDRHGRTVARELFLAFQHKSLGWNEREGIVGHMGARHVFHLADGNEFRLAPPYR
jgi:hypothetical protein